MPSSNLPPTSGSSLASLMGSYVELKQLDDLEGCAKTAIAGVTFYRSSTGSPRQPFTYQSGIIILGQGSKRVYLGQQQFNYGACDYLVLGVPLPLECEAIAEPDKPILGLSIEVDPQLLHQMVAELSAHDQNHRVHNKAMECGLTSAGASLPMMAACERLLQSLHDETEAQILGSGIVAEILFRVLTQEQGHVLFELASHEGHYARIARTLSKLHREYQTIIHVDTLANEANMSLSAFHRAFRQVTLETPLQYLKKVRLNKAKELIVLEGVRACDAANFVGYSSVSQFSREFKRHFNTTPKASLLG